MFLNELNEGEVAKVKRLNTESSFSARLRDMGFSEGEKIECVKTAVFKSPVLYRVKGSLIALRKTDSKNIEVEI